MIAADDICAVVMEIRKINNISKVIKWINDNQITRIGFSYRLDPHDAKDYYCNLVYQLKNSNVFFEDGGPVRGVSFAGLPDACELIKSELGEESLVFPGDESPVESLRKYGVPESLFPNTIKQESPYDSMRWQFAEQLIASESYKYILPQEHFHYPECGTRRDTFIKRLTYCREHQSLPIIRVHVDPYNSNRTEALKEFNSWARELAQSRLLDVLSIGSSQLTQSNFGEDWSGMHNGGGGPINSEQEYRDVAIAANPMLVRTYAGTKNIPQLAAIHERALNISWHALSFWWFCEIDGRGKNTVLENLREHFETIRYAAQTQKPVEPNVPHHFAFRGTDDITYIISGYLTAKSIKRIGVNHLILQNMLNTPKYTWGIEDLAKGRAMLKLVRELEDKNFSVSLQTRAGLDYFSVQLAAVTALMDDLEPDNPNSPEIIHVVSYSEAVRLATPDVIKESIQITLSSLQEYRRLRKTNRVGNMTYDRDVLYRTNDLYEEAKEAIDFLESHTRIYIRRKVCS